MDDDLTPDQPGSAGDQPRGGSTPPAARPARTSKTPPSRRKPQTKNQPAAARKAAQASAAAQKSAPAHKAAPAKKSIPKPQRPTVIDVSAADSVSGGPEIEVRFSHTGPTEANSEQELAHADGTELDGTELGGADDELSEDGDQSVGAVAAFAESVKNKPAGVPSLAVTEPASAEDVERAWQDNRLAQVLYHDWEAGTYDEKWSISFDERCITYARDRFSSLLGPEILRTEGWPYAKALEIGAGTGFFSLNLKQAGVLDEVHVSDISAGMVENAKANAVKLGFEVQGEVALAESLPYDDDTFDIVVGHAVIHHIPDVESALREILRVLKPGGRFVIAGEPTRIGDWYARRLGRVTWELTTRATALPPLREKWAKSKEELDASSRAAALEAVVDLHTFVPAELEAMAQRAGAQEIHTQTEELLAAFLGWPVRTFEAAVNPARLGFGWSMFAYKSWQRLSALDRVLSRAVPKQFFYNVGITGIKH